jgi:hypothetical protein
MVIILHHDINRGGGAANKSLLNFIKQHPAITQTKQCVMYDADGQMNIKDMEVFMNMVNTHPEAEIFYGSRFIDGADTKTMPLLRRCILLMAKVVTFMFYGSKITDPHNGYRVLKISAIKKITITSDGMHYANELVDEIRRYRIPYVEVVTNTIYTEHSLNKAHAQRNFHSIRL